MIMSTKKSITTTTQLTMSISPKTKITVMKEARCFKEDVLVYMSATLTLVNPSSFKSSKDICNHAGGKTLYIFAN